MKWVKYYCETNYICMEKYEQSNIRMTNNRTSRIHGLLLRTSYFDCSNVRCSVFFLFIAFPTLLFAQLDAKKIAADYQRSVVKILLYDSLAEKNQAGNGYIGRGSGFIVSEDGVIFTNRHVVDMCVQGYVDYDYYDEQSGTVERSLEVYSADLLSDSGLVKINRIGYPAPIVQVYSGKGVDDYKLYYAKVLSVSMGSFDGAIIRIVSDLEGKPLENTFLPLPLGNSDSTFQGEDLCVYGYPENYTGAMDMMLKEMSTLTFGKHSGFDFAYSKDFGYIKTEAAINSGNSGGPVFNQYNKVVGIATAAFNKTNIGLVGGINAMYYVAATDIGMLQKLSSRGLKVPKNAGAIKTVNGDHQPTLTAQEITKVNAQKQAAHEARLARIEQQKQADAYKNFYPNGRSPKDLRFSMGMAAGLGSYTRGNLDLFWQSINNDASLKATGKGSPFVWTVDIEILGTDKKEKNFGGFGIHFFKTAKRAIAASNEYLGATNEISLGLTMVNFSFIYSRALGKKTYLLFEPSVLYYSSMKGSITAYGNTYTVKPSVPFGGGWQLAGGINYMVTDLIGISFRAGYRFITLQEMHKDDRDGYSLTYSFFANGVDGETTLVKWNGMYFMTGLVLSGATNIKKAKKTEQRK